MHAPTRALLAAACVLLAAMHAAARPYRGSVKVSVLLCRFSGSGSPPAPYNDPNYYRDLVFNAGTGGLADYWGNVSYSGVNLQGSEVRGWYQSSMTLATCQSKDTSRGARYNDCVNTAKANGYTVPAGNQVFVITYPGCDFFGFTGGSAAYVDYTVSPGGLAHEGGHGLGFIHSFSNDTGYKNADWAQPGEYDNQWDMMSFGNVYGFNTARFGSSGPGMNAYHVDRMGWLPRTRIFTMGSAGETSATISLMALSNYPPKSPLIGLSKSLTQTSKFGDLLKASSPSPSTSTSFGAEKLSSSLSSSLRGALFGGGSATVGSGGTKIGDLLSPATDKIYVSPYPSNYYLLARIPYDPNDRFAYFTVEYRRKTGMDAGIPWDNQILISQVKRWRATDGSDQGWGSFLLKSLPSRNPVDQTFTFGSDGTQITITVTAKDSWTATVKITSNFALRCKSGYVWRGACPNDYTCVTPGVRSQVWADNAQAGNRRQPGGGAYGPNTCRQGYVWRDACANDFVCVTPDVRTQARNDNAQAGGRVDNKAAVTYGPNTCASGYVWREADEQDWVCVAGWMRDQVRADNAAARSRWVNGAYGPKTCISGFVWREAFPGDYVCVTPAMRTQVRADNAAAPSRLWEPRA